MRFVIVIPSSLLLLIAIFMIGSTRGPYKPQTVYPAPNTAEEFLKRGRLYEQEGNYEKALSDYLQAEQLTPEDSSVYLGQGSSLSALNQPDEAIEKYRIAREIDLRNGQSTRLIDYLIEKEEENL